jgi:sirohydrochlorin ferrochelatase
MKRLPHRQGTLVCTPYRLSPRGHVSERCTASASIAEATANDTARGTDSTSGAKSVPIVSSTVAVVIVDHGSRRSESNDMLTTFAELYAQVTDRSIVEVAHMEIAEPTLLQAVQKCIDRGAAQVIVAPYFLSNGRHIQVDIPEQVLEARTRYPRIPIQLANPIGASALNLVSSFVRYCSPAFLSGCLSCLHGVIHRQLALSRHAGLQVSMN